jgi:inhibitor of KinA
MIDPPGSLQFCPVGDSALLVTFGDGIDVEINRRVHRLSYRLIDKSVLGVIEAVPAYCSLLVHYDPLVMEYPTVLDFVSALAKDPGGSSYYQPRRVDIPTVYGGEFGPDLVFVAGYHHLTPQEVIRIHTGVDYQVYMLGFTPGFAYLGGLDAVIATPRLEKPRTRIPAGSVGIAGAQTGIYPLETPGGWRIIGRTTLRMFDPLAEPPVRLAPGDLVRFIPITPDEVESVTGCP